VPYWAWLALGLLLAASELLVTQLVLIWFGLAGIAVGALSWLFPGLGIVAELVLFGLLSVMFLVPARAWRRRWRDGGGSHKINQRAAQQVGRVALLKEPIANGRGNLFLGDTLWHVEGPDLPAGKNVRIVSYHGSTLLVEEAE
jgi:membrane protein implicated in regulation of membrane protease activity